MDVEKPGKALKTPILRERDPAGLERGSVRRRICNSRESA